MRIWKCDMCGAILENGEDVMEIVCKEGSEKTSYPNSYEVCRECAKKVDKFLRKELTLDFYPALKTIYDYCKSQDTCDECLLKEEKNGGPYKCMAGFPEDNWAKSYPDLKKEREGK